jgi:CopG antitoxin of type II toxin-antitoxin system
MKKLKPIPSFETEAQERKFWETHDTTDYLGLEQGAARALSKLEALNNHDFNTAATRLAGADQDCRKQVRRAVSVADQDVAGGEG